MYSTRVANELGAGNLEGARLATRAAMFLAVTETSTETTTLYACRHVFGYIFSNEKDVIDYVVTMAPLVCLSLVLDSFQGVLTGKLNAQSFLQISILLRNKVFNLVLYTFVNGKIRCC